jgi:hypothetical protein
VVARSRFPEARALNTESEDPVKRRDRLQRLNVRHLTNMAKTDEMRLRLSQMDQFDQCDATFSIWTVSETDFS